MFYVDLRQFTFRVAACPLISIGVLMLRIRTVTKCSLIILILAYQHA